jgi:hypothetical protein
MQNLENPGQLALNLTVAVPAVEVADGTFAPANRRLLEPTPDPNGLVQQPESGSCGFEYSRSSPEQCIGESPDDSEPTGGSEVITRELEVLASLAKRQIEQDDRQGAHHAGGYCESTCTEPVKKAECDEPNPASTPRLPRARHRASRQRRRLDDPGRAHRRPRQHGHFSYRRFGGGCLGELASISTCTWLCRVR